MSLVILYLSKPGGHKNNAILGNPEMTVVLDQEDLGLLDSNSGGVADEWVDSGLLFPKYRGRQMPGGDNNRLLVVVARGSIYLKQTIEGETVDDTDTTPIPVNEEGITQYVCYIHPDTKTLWVKAPEPPDAEPNEPWWRAWWPF